MNIVESINIHKGIAQKKIITITWVVIDVCNYTCWYCIAESIKKYKTKVEQKELELFIHSLHRIHTQRPECKIELIIGGGEPGLNPLLGNIVSTLSDLDFVSRIILTTNGTHLKKHLENSHQNLREKLIIKKSYHQKEEKNIDTFIEDTQKIQEMGFQVYILFLYDYLVSEEKIDGALSKLYAAFPTNMIEHHKLIIDGVASTNYSQKQEKIYKENAKIPKYEGDTGIEKLIIKHKDGSLQEEKIHAKNTRLADILDHNKKYKGYLCDPSYFHIVRPDGLTLYGGCDIFGFTEHNKNFYDPEFRLFDRMIHCTKSSCFCRTSVANPKKRDEQKIKYYKKIDSILGKIQSTINKKIQKIKIHKLRLIDNGLSVRRIKISIYIPGKEKNIFITQEIDRPFIGNIHGREISDIGEKTTYDEIKKDLGIIIQNIPMILYSIQQI